MVAAVILNWNGWRDTIACLESMLKLEYPPDRLAIILCDNGSTDDSLERIGAWAEGTFAPELDAPPGCREFVAPPSQKPVTYRVIDPHALESGQKVAMASCITTIPLLSNLGFAGGNNVVLRQLFRDTEVEHVLLINNDVVVDRHALRALVGTLERHGPACAVGGILLDFREPSRVQEAGGGIFRMWQGMSEPHLAPPMNGEQPGYLTAAFMIAPRELLARVGGFAEDYFMYCEDVDYSIRLRQAGATFSVAVGARAWHRGGGSSGYRSPRHDYYVVRNALQLIRRFSPLTLPLAMVYLGIRCGVPKLARREWVRLSVMRRAYSDFLAGKMGQVVGLPGDRYGQWK